MGPVWVWLLGAGVQVLSMAGPELSLGPWAGPQPGGAAAGAARREPAAGGEAGVRIVVRCGVHRRGPQGALHLHWRLVFCSL